MLDQEAAQTLFHCGGTLVFLDVPEGTEFGIDYNTWIIGPNFRGVKMIPPGVHFVYYSAVNSDKQTGPRSGFFHVFTKGEVLVKHWDKQAESISTTPVSVEEQERVEASKMELDSFLGAYPYDSYKKWVSLTSHMTADVVALLQPEGGYVYSAAQFLSEPSNSQQRIDAAMTVGKLPESQDSPESHRASLAESLLPQMAHVPGTYIRYTQIPRQKYPAGASPAEVTKHNMDHSYVLEQVLLRYSHNAMLLGELQFAFTCFVLGQSYDSFEQWKLLVALMSSCSGALCSHTQLFSDFMAMLHYQLREIPQDFFVDIVSQENFLVQTLHRFLENLRDSGTPAALRERGDRFAASLQKRFNWDFTVEPDDEQPVVVM